MRAITIREPWASMIARGKKTIEVRTWKTTPGPILLCAAKNPKGPLSGHAFAVANIIDVRPMVPGDVKKTGGYYDKTANSWILNDLNLISPFPVRGMPGIFHVDL